MQATNYRISKYSKDRYFLVFLLGFAVMMVTLIPFMICEKGRFIYYGDYNAQQIPFYSLVNDAVRSGQFGWNWYTDLGTDLLSSYSFYLTGSPFFWLTVLLPRGAVTYAMPFLLALKHGIATLTAYIYIRRFVRGKQSALTGALLYAFSGFQIYNIFFNHFQDVTAFFPLMLIAMEENINNHRKGAFAFTVALMACINYYFFCGQAVFLVIYYLFRMKCPDFHTSWKKFFLLCFEAVIGTAVAGAILLPSFLLVINNTRVSDPLFGTDALIYKDSTVIPRIIQTFFMPSDPPAFPILFDSDYEKWASIGGYFPLFGMIGVITFMRTHRKHWATRISYFLIICAMIPILNCLFQAANGYYYARWFYMPILLFAMMTSRTIDEEGVKIKPAMIISIAMLALFIFQSLMPIQLRDGGLLYLSVPSDIKYFWITMCIALFSLMIVGYLFDLKNRGKSYGHAMVWTTAVFCVGLIFTTTLYNAVSPEKANEYIDSAIDGGSEVYENLSEDNFFRVDMSNSVDNYPMFWQLPSIRAFQSVVEPSIMKFYQAIDMDRAVASRPDPDHYTLRGLFSVKYYYRQKTNDMRFASGIPESSSEKKNNSFANLLGDKIVNNAIEVKEASQMNIPEEMPGFEYVGENEYFEIYENKLYIPMGMGFSKYVSESTLESRSKKIREKLLMNALILSDEQIEKYSDILTEVPEADLSGLNKTDYREFCEERLKNCSSSFTFDSYGFKSVIDLDSPQLVFFSVPYSKGWTAEVNGKPADIEKVSYGFMAVKADSGNNTIEFHYETPGLKHGIMITGAALLILIMYLLICRRFRGKEKEFGFAHTYDYTSCHGVAPSQLYCNSFRREPEKTDKKKKAPRKASSGEKK